MVGRDTVVMIASDGLDVGVPDLLRDAMRELHRRSAGGGVVESAARDRGLRADCGRDERGPPFITTFASVTDQAGLARLSRLVRLRPSRPTGGLESLRKVKRSEPADARLTFSSPPS